MGRNCRDFMMMIQIRLIIKTRGCHGATVILFREVGSISDGGIVVGYVRTAEY